MLQTVTTPRSITTDSLTTAIMEMKNMDNRSFISVAAGVGAVVVLAATLVVLTAVIRRKYTREPSTNSDTNTEMQAKNGECITIISIHTHNSNELYASIGEGRDTLDTKMKGNDAYRTKTISSIQTGSTQHGINPNQQPGIGNDAFKTSMQVETNENYATTISNAHDASQQL